MGHYFSIGVISLIVAGVFVWLPSLTETSFLNKVAAYSFEDCVRAGFSVIETRPRQCRDATDTVFLESDYKRYPITYTNTSAREVVFDHLSSQNNIIASPLVFTGKAVHEWFSDDTFPVIVADANGALVGHGAARARHIGEFGELVPFEVQFSFKKPTYSSEGKIILRSASTLERARVELPIIFE